MTKNEQLELTIDGISTTRRATRPVTRHSSRVTSSWWFSRMRQFVDSARDWTPAATPRSTFRLHLSE